MSHALQTTLELVLSSNEDVVSQTTNAVPAVSAETETYSELDWHVRDIAVEMVRAMFDDTEEQASAFPEVYAQVMQELTTSRPAVSLEPDTTIEVKPQSASHKPAFDREHHIRILCRSIEKAGYLKTSNDLLPCWFPGKSDEFVARAYAKAKELGQARIVLKMLAYEQCKIAKYGSTDALPRQLREALM